VPGLTAKQHCFVEEYLKDLNATQAAIRAGYSAKTANRIGPELLSKPAIAEAVAQAKHERSKQTGIDAAWVLEQLKDIFEADRTEIYDANRRLRPFSEWPSRLRRLLKGFKKSELLFYGDPIRVLELIGKHVDVGAFKEQHEFSTKDDMPVKILVEYARAQESPKETSGSKQISGSDKTQQAQAGSRRSQS
jgi:phage terminase small subunit